MEAVLYAEVYLVCFLVVGLLLFWTAGNNTVSSTDLWLGRLLRCFLLNFLSNLLFTVFNRIWVLPGLAGPLSVALKTAYFVTLACGVYAYGGYAEAELQSGALEKGGGRTLALALLGAALLIPAVNLFTPWMFEIGEDLSYRRGPMFRAELWGLFAATLICALRLLRRAAEELNPARRSHLRLTASFPLCLPAAALLSYAGEAVPVICVCVTAQLLCLTLSAMRGQISMDELTQVNNRRNLNSYLNHKTKSNSGRLRLLMIDLDFFKQINDTFGHLEGDRALVQLAQALKLSCAELLPRPYIARYGGDEFIVVLEGGDAEAEALCAELRRRLDELNAAPARYRLSVSIGVGRWREGMDGSALIGDADEHLYRVKKAR